MDNMNRSVGKLSGGVPFTFTFVPVLRKLPSEIPVTVAEGSGPPAAKQSLTASREKASGQTMSAGDIFKVETVFISDPVEGGAGNVLLPKITNQLQPLPDHVSPPESRPRPQVGAQAENTAGLVAAGTTSMETAVGKHGRAPQRRCRDAAGLSEVSSSFFANRTSPTDSADALTPTASSRESLLSEDLDRETGWSALQPPSVTSPVSLSRTVSPCSSVLSGIFSPAVVQIRKHFLAPGSSLIHTPQTCFSSCESLSSCCPQSPPPRRRPPLTRLSLLTAILRKGRLPVLSPAVQRPYTPCWPINPVTLSFCNACSAASSVASIPLELSSQFSSTTSIDSQGHVHRCATAPASSNEPPKVRSETPVKRCFEQVRSSQVISPPPVKPDTFSRTPLPRLCSKARAAAPLPQAHRAATKVRHRPNIFISKSFKLEPTNVQVRGPADRSPTLISSSSQHFIHQATPVCPSPAKKSSLSKLHMLSEKLRSPPRSPLQPSPSPGLARTAPHLPPSRPAVGSGESHRTAKTSEGSQRTPSLPLTHRTRPCSPQWLPPIGSPTPTLSPAPPSRDLSLSPSPPLHSTPPPRLKSGISDYSDREGKKRKTHKIKLNYKSLAAIPTNTLLLDQQVIDEQVERGDSGVDKGVPDTHAEMCSPAQFRQQSAELYAVIDEVLADSIPPTPQHSRTPTPTPGLQAKQNNSSSPKSLGRETKYASLCSLPPSNKADRNQLGSKKMKPGIIRPMTAIPRLRVEDEEGYERDAFDIRGSFLDSRKVEKDFYALSTHRGSRDMWKPERRSPSTAWDLQITEAEDGPPVKGASASFSPN
ncbi:muscular LMNA-interacting protein isoform X1 [Takifugu flavidus]|uniref:muscular LMNA-interacting protein isoform X1 n=1 Tax=Takifugu flavidus TaxID=433684 RepID=UPI00254407F8|nr:muscular LMNA-interacting protein isoform X1 [Takifugu flavidus]